MPPLSCTVAPPSSHAKFAEVVCQCFQSGSPNLGGDLPTELVGSTFTQLGGDSLAALQVVGTIQRETGAVVPPEVVLTGRVADVVQYIVEKAGLAVADKDLFAKLEPLDRGWQWGTTLCSGGVLWVVM